MEIQNNKVTISGEITSGFRFSHDVFRERFYLIDVSVNRLSGISDTIPLMVSERIIDISQSQEGKRVKVQGQFRSYNRHVDGKSRLLLSVFVRELTFLEESIDASEENRISLNGYICKAPTYRITPKGREIADLLVAVNRPFGKSDYIPCIVWGRNARYVAGLHAGVPIQLYGRIQSREYLKLIDEDNQEKRIAYEVSTSSLIPPELIPAELQQYKQR